VDRCERRIGLVSTPRLEYVFAGDRTRERRQSTRYTQHTDHSTPHIAHSNSTQYTTHATLHSHPMRASDDHRWSATATSTYTCFLTRARGVADLPAATFPPLSCKGESERERARAGGRAVGRVCKCVRACVRPCECECAGNFFCAPAVPSSRHRHHSGEWMG
jgi:hypothetical protein